MTILTLPDSRFRSVEPFLDRPAQVNRSAYTGARQVVGLPGGARWRFAAEHVPIIGEAAFRPWRAALAKLKGVENTFRMPAGEGAQRVGANPSMRQSRGYGLTNIAGCSIGATSVTRSLATAGAWNAGAYMTEAIGADGGVFWGIGQTNKAVMVGVNKTPAVSSGYVDQPFTLYHHADGNLRLVEGGVIQFTVGAYSTSDIFGIAISGNKLTYLQSSYPGYVIVQRTITPAATYHLDISIFDQGATVDRIGLAPLPNASTIGISGVTPSALFLPAGSFLTLWLANGGFQLVQLTQDATADGSGNAALVFEPPLRGAPMPVVGIETVSPYAIVALDEPTGWRVDPGQQYSFSLSASEAF